MDKMLIFGLFLKLLGYWLSWLFANILKKIKINKKVDLDSLLRKCAYQAIIIQNLDVVTLELGMKVQFANF
jgi:hypothetical protein